MIDESWLVTLMEKLRLNSRFRFLDHTAIETVLQLGNRFAASVPAEIARNAITANPSGRQFERTKEKVGTIVGWTNLARLADLPSNNTNETFCYLRDGGSMTARELVQSCINLLHMIVNVAPRFLTSSCTDDDDEDEEDDGTTEETMSGEEKEEYERIIKDAARSAINTLLHDKLLPSLTPEFVLAHVIPDAALAGEKERARLSAAAEELLPHQHPLVLAFRSLSKF